MKNRLLKSIFCITILSILLYGLSFTVFAINDSDMIVSAGWRDTFVIKKDGSLWGWGINRYGEIGNGAKEPVLTPAKIMNDVSSVSNFEAHTVAVKKDGTLWGWGYNRYGQLAPESDEYFLKPIKLMDDVKMASAGRHATAVVKKDNTLWIAGQDGQGDGKPGDAKAGFRKAMDKVKFVVAGEDVIFVIKEDDTLWGWGFNESGVIGNGTMTGDNTLSGSGKLVLTAKKVMDDVSYVTSTGAVTMAIRKDGSLWMWGGKGNDFYTMDEVLTKRPASPVKVMENVQHVASSKDGDEFVAIKPDGSVWGWGRFNVWGINESSIEPKKLMDDVNLISIGEDHIAIVKKDNTLWMAGNNYYAPLGFGENSGTKKVAQLMSDIMDSPDSWAVQEVKEAIYRKLVPPDMQSEYRKTVTRSEFCTLAMVLIEQLNEMTVEDYIAMRGITMPTKEPFEDLDELDSRATKDIIAAYTLNIVEGTSETTFEPNKLITREQAAKLLTATAAALGEDTLAPTPSFADTSEIADWAKPYIGYVFQKKVMTGIGDNNFGPKGGYQRQQAYMTMLRLYNVIDLK